MNFEELLKRNKIEKLALRQEFSLDLSMRDLGAAKNSLKNKDFDWAFSIAYNSVLQSGRSLMFYLGFRPKGNEQHKTVFEFLMQTGLDKSSVNYFDKIRRKRNLLIYRDAYIISGKEAEETLAEAQVFVQKIRTFVQKIRTEK